jgi:hypothetical protein
MSTFSDPKNVIYLVEIIVYVFVLFYAGYLLFRQFAINKAGWISVLIFTILKIVGSAINLYVGHQEDDGQTPSTGLITAGLVCLSISLGPLMTAVLHFITRGCETMDCPDGPLISQQLKRIPYLCVMIATILSIVGFTEQDQTGGSSTGRALSKASSILFLIGYLIIMVLVAICLNAVGSRYNPALVSYLYCFVILIPFFVTRVLYSIISAFSADANILAYHTFSVFNGNWKVYLVMVVIMEVVISVTFCIAGYLAERKIRREGPVPMDLYKQPV